jgi:hypothetical protein
MDSIQKELPDKPKLRGIWIYFFSNPLYGLKLGQKTTSGASEPSKQPCRAIQWLGLQFSPIVNLAHAQPLHKTGGG